MRTALAAVLVIVATLLAPFVIAAAWVDSTLGETDSYVDTIAPLAEQQRLRDQLAAELATATSVALAQHIPVALPRAVDRLVAEAAREVVDSRGFAEFWREANRHLHAEFLRIVDEDRDTDADPYLRVDLSPLLADVFGRLDEHGIPTQLLPEVPLEAPLVRESRLAEHSDTFALVRTVGHYGLMVLAALVLLAVVVATGIRGRIRTLGFAALGIALAAAVTMAATGPLTDLAADRAGEGRSGLVRLIVGVVTESLAPYARTFLVVAAPLGLILLAASWLPARDRSATSERVA